MARPRAIALSGSNSFFRVVGKPRVILKWSEKFSNSANLGIPVGLVLGYLAAGKTAEDTIAEFPDLTRDQIAACLDYARELAEFEAVV
jgi:hypothetical protein